MTRKLQLKEWPEEDRPREKLALKGKTELSDAELLAIIIGSGNKDETAVELSRRILNKSKGNIIELSKFSIDFLKNNFKGIGDAKAISIIAALELAKRINAPNLLKNERIKSSEDVHRAINKTIGSLAHEEFWIILLNRANKIIDKVKISQGGVSGTVVDIKIILKFTIEKLSSSVVLCHNHPSGNEQPSKEDIDITTKLTKAFQSIDVNLLDHLIVTNNTYFSFADEGLLN